MSFVHIGLCLLGGVMMLTVFGWLFDLDWLVAYGTLFELLVSFTMIVVLVTMFFVDGKYDGVSDGEIKTYSECYSEHGRNVCEDVLDNKVIVDDYWKK